MEYDIARPSRTCAASGRELSPGSVVFSALAADGAALRRLDYAAECWHGPPEGTLAWWKTRLPLSGEHGPKLAPGEILLSVFQQLETQPERRELRYVLALLLVRRRVMKLESTTQEADGTETLELFSPADRQTYRVAALPLAPERREQIQLELCRLVFPEEAPGKTQSDQ
jgi:hypothetical protein